MKLWRYFVGVLTVASVTGLPWPEVLEGFDSPETRYRPKFRYWLPDASADVDAVKQDIRAMASVGAGGFEFLPYYQFRGYSSSDWSEYAYGTDAYHNIFHEVLVTAKNEGLLMDVAIGANQGQGVPAIPETEGLAVHLAYSNVTITPGQRFNGILALSKQPIEPAVSQFMHDLEDFGSQKLFAVLAIETIPSNTTSNGYTSINRIIDLTHLAEKETRKLSWKAPNSTLGTSWRIMAWYERHTNQRSIDGGMKVENTIQNGSWIVDHFSTSGAQLMTTFFENYVLRNRENENLLAQVGNYAWEDSMEMNSILWWTPGLESRFLEQQGYDIRTCLPLLLNQNNSWASTHVPGGEGFTSIDSTVNIACNQAYRLALQSGYKDYISTFKEWSHGKGLEFSNQPAYNLPLNMVDAVPLVDVPEGESFGFKDNIDAYRHFSGPANFVGNRVVSSECGAISRVAYSQTLNELLYSVHRGLAGGISMNVFHGYPYSGTFPNTTWPGVTIFSYLFTEIWGPRQPLWNHFPELMLYVSRNQLVAQSGKPRVDLAVYANDAPWNAEKESQYTELHETGFTYNYVGPASLTSKFSVVQDNKLNSDGPSYKALVLSDQTIIDLELASKIQQMAKNGLPIFFIGTPVTSNMRIDNIEDSAVKAIIETLLSSGLDNVLQIATAKDLVGALKAAGIKPNLRPLSNQPVRGWYSFWRRTPTLEIVWLYRDPVGAKESEKTVEFTFSGMARTIPLILDAWTGRATPMVHYQQNAEDLIIPVSLGVNQTIIIAFKEPDENLTKSPPIVESTLGNVAGLEYIQNPDGVHVRASLLQGSSSILLSNGTTLNFNTILPKTENLSLWNIEIQSWQRPNDSQSVETHIKTYSYQNSTLSSWLKLDPSILADVSGIGHYTTKFRTPISRKSQRLGARLHVGKFQTSARLRFNGVLLPLLPFEGTNNNVVDLTDIIQSSDDYNTMNVLEIEIATTLLNRVQKELNITTSFGVPANLAASASYAAIPPTEYGLIGPVWVEWVELVTFT